MLKHYNSDVVISKRESGEVHGARRRITTRGRGLAKLVRRRCMRRDGRGDDGHEGGYDQKREDNAYLAFIQVP
jgi:hypothetical protein